MLLRPFISLARTYLRKSPSILTLFVTNRCNARCRMCFYWKNIEESRTREELSLEEISRIADHFKGLYSLVISGGEPFLRDDLDDIVSEFHARTPVKQVSIPTNLFCSDGPEKIKEMALKHPDIVLRILVSIDGIGEDHDMIRGHKGGFGKLTANLERIAAYRKGLKNLDVSSITVMSSFNAEKIRSIIDFAADLKVDDIRIMRARGDTREPEAKDISVDEYRKCLEYAEAVSAGRDGKGSFYSDLLNSASRVAKEKTVKPSASSRLFRRCNAGSRIIVISETGEVFPCETLPEKLGDLRQHDYSIDSVMRSDRAKSVLGFIGAGKCSCIMDCNAAVSNVIYSPYLYPSMLRKYISSRFPGRPRCSL